MCAFEQAEAHTRGQFNCTRLIFDERGLLEREPRGEKGAMDGRIFD